MFTANCSYSFNDYLCINEYHSRHAGKRNHIISIILGLALIGMGVWYSIENIGDLLLQIFLISFGVFSVFRIYAMSFLTYRSVKKRLVNLHYEFGDEMFTVCSQSKQSSTYYTAVDTVDVIDGAVYIYIKKLGVHYIPIKDIYGGTGDEFCEFLSEKTGKEIGHK